MTDHLSMIEIITLPWSPSEKKTNTHCKTNNVLVWLSLLYIIARPFDSQCTMCLTSDEHRMMNHEFVRMTL